MRFFIDDQQLQKHAAEVEASGQALNFEKTETNEVIHVSKLLSVVRVGKEEHKQIHKVELKAAYHLGLYLIKKKADLKHGDYTPFLKEHGITTQDASRFCTVAEKWEEIKLKGYTDYSISTVLYKLKEDTHNAIDGGYLNSVSKHREDIASEASGREAILLRKLSDAEARLAAEQTANQQLQARLEEFQLNGSSANVNDRVRVFVAHSFYEDEIMSYLH